MKPLISIIIPVFNSEKFISDTIESIINQNINFDNLELIIVDDKSTDNTEKVIEKYSNKYNNIKFFVLKENNGCPGKPRNIGIQNANADYIMFCDADDLYFRDMCKTLYDSILKYDADFVSSRYTVKFNNKKETLNNSFLDKYENVMLFNSIEEFPEIVYTTANLTIWNKIYKKTFLFENNINFEEKHYGEDYLFSLKTYIKSKKFVLLNKYSGYLYRNVNENSATYKKISKEEFVNNIIEPLHQAQNLIEEENFNHDECLFEFLVQGTYLFFQQNFSLKDKKEILTKIHPFYKKYYITNNLVNQPLFLNVFINIAIKIFSINNNFTIWTHSFYNKIRFKINDKKSR